MNFYDLSAKLRAIEESTVAECGDMMPAIAHAPQQSNSVTMNVSMNGSGPGGIKDLMDILRNIEQAAEHDHKEPMIAQPHSSDGDVDIVLGTADEDMLADPDAQSGAGAGDESYGNSAPGGSDAHQFGIDTVTHHGDDMHSKGSVKRLRVNGGENPLQEGLVERLNELYSSIKEDEKRTMSRAAKGVMKYGKDGMKALAKAGKEGKDLEPIQDKYNKYDESAKWRDPKHKDKLYTQDPNDDDDHYDYYHDSRPDNDPGQKHSTFDRDKRTDKLHYPYGDYQVGQKAQVGDRAKKGLLTKNAIRVVKNRINSAHGDHPTPKLPK